MNNNNHNNHNQPNPIQSLPTSKKLQMELNKMEKYKHFKLQLLKKIKSNVINENDHFYQPQVNAIQSQQNQLIQQFDQYCINELQRIKLQKTNHPIHINFEKLYEEFIKFNDIKTNKNNNLNSNQCKKRNKIRSCQYTKNGKFDPSLQVYQINDDLGFLMQEAMKKNIEIDDDILMTNKQRKQRQRKFVDCKEPDIDQQDMNEIKEICNKLSMGLTNKQLSVRLYSYKTHLDVYKAIFYWITKCDKMQRNQIINELQTNPLRDIKIKLRSSGKVGRKKEMADGINQALDDLQSKYQSLK